MCQVLFPYPLWFVYTQGFAQAEKTRALVRADLGSGPVKVRLTAECGPQQLQNRTFDALFVSPLRRARQTAATVWSPRSGEPIVLPSLREVDLYSFQGQTKADAKGSPRYVDWSKAPHKFELDGHAPVRELWYRASVAWASILGAVNDSVLPANGASSRTQHVLVVRACFLHYNRGSCADAREGQKRWHTMQ